jgi:hypothetical protein
MDVFIHRPYGDAVQSCSSGDSPVFEFSSMSAQVQTTDMDEARRAKYSAGVHDQESRLIRYKFRREAHRGEFGASWSITTSSNDTYTENTIWIADCRMVWFMIQDLRTRRSRLIAACNSPAASPWPLIVLCSWLVALARPLITPSSDWTSSHLLLFDALLLWGGRRRRWRRNRRLRLRIGAG